MLNMIRYIKKSKSCESCEYHSCVGSKGVGGKTVAPSQDQHFPVAE